MKRILYALFALLLLVDCQPAASSTTASPAPSHETEPAAPSIEPLDREVPFLLSEHRDSWWADAGSEYHRYTRYLDVDQAGFATLSLNDLSFLVTPKGGETYLLSAELSENLYSDPVCCIRFGEIRLWTDNAAVRVEFLKDPYGIFAGLPEADLSMSYQKTHHEWQYYDWPDVSPSSLPAEQPHTDWVTMFTTGDMFNRLELHSDESGQVRGTLVRERDREVESTIPCALLTGSGYACVVQYNESGYGEPLLFGSLVPSGYDDQPKEYVTLCVLPLYCVYGAVEPHDPYYPAEDSENSGILKCIKETFDTGCDAGVFDVYEALEAGDYRLSMGVDRIVAEYYLCQSGWVRIDPQPESDRWYRVYQKSGDTLVLIFDDELTEYGLTKYIVGYVCYDIDGAVKAWGGLKPLDHVFVDSYEFKKDEPDFRQTAGVTGYFITDHDMLYFTDDMRFVFVTQFNGDFAIEVDPVIPPLEADSDSLHNA